MNKVVLFVFLLAANIIEGKQEWIGQYYNLNSSQQYSNALNDLKDFDLKKYKKILDLGCGSGKITREIAALSPDSEVVGVDFSADMIKEANQIINGIKNLSFKVADAQGLAYEEEFDLIFSFSCFHWIEDQQKALNCIAHALKPEGTLFIRMASKLNGKSPIFKAVLNTAYKNPKWVALFKATDPKKQYFATNKVEFEKMVEKAGLKIINSRIREKIRKFESLESFKSWARGWFGGFPLVALLPDNLQNELLDDVMLEYAKIVPVDIDGSIEYLVPSLIIQAKK